VLPLARYVTLQRLFVPEDSISMDGRLRENLADDDGFRVPEVDWRRTARRVLTLNRVAGIPIDEVAALTAAGHDLDAIIEKAARAFFNQALRDGFFHGDLHPGNLFVDEHGDIVAVDFGIMGRLDVTTRRYLAEILLGFLTGDYARVAEVHFEAGYVPANKSRAAFTQACRSIGEPILDRPLSEIALGQLLAQFPPRLGGKSRGGVEQPVGLLLDGLDHPLVAVADVNVHELGRPVDIPLHILR
jgi:predicted unusual protein kinase regulating ubiquinone biosynthesis (AarF/ABC1/UbiB family)